MGDVSYKPLIEDMTWSFSRIEAFGSCGYKWYLKYIKGRSEDDRFYSSYGKLIHKILQLYYSGEMKKQDMYTYFITHFQTDVTGERPDEGIVRGYFQSGADYLRSFKPFDLNCVGTEIKADVMIHGIPFTGYIDLLGEKDGEYIIVDHKSRSLKHRSGRKKPTVNDRTIDDMLKQLYIYSAFVKKQYGKFPKELWFNCFRNGEIICEEFDQRKYEEAIGWAFDTVKEIENTEEFAEAPDLFKCRWLCGFSDECEYYDEFLEEWRRNRD